MNWSTRLRRWVRIRTPPVREASTKPTAATVLPAPVACSNQKRRLAPGSSGASSISVLARRPRARPSPAAPRRARARPRPRRAPRLRRCRSPPRLAVGLGLGAVAASVAPRRAVRALELGDDRGQRSRERVDLVLVELGAVEQRRPVLVEQALEPEQQRVVAAPLEATGARRRRRARRARRRPPPARGARARGRRSSRPRAGSARARTRAPDRGRPRSARSPRSAATSVELAMGKGV